MRRPMILAASLMLLPAAALAFPKSGSMSPDMVSPAAAPAAPGPGPRVAEAPPQPVAGNGKVMETMNSGGYSYVLLQGKDGEKKWFAVPETNVLMGQQLSIRAGVEMKNFTSKTLSKTFDSIVFSPGLSEQKGGVTGAASAAKVPATAVKNVKVTKATGPGAYTIGEVFGKRKALNGKKVTVRGKVVKVSTGIMKKNWIHIQDGTGKTKKTKTLVVTSTTLPNEGDVVTIQGTLASDRDFGAGYKYDAIVENATVTKN